MYTRFFQPACRWFHYQLIPRKVNLPEQICILPFIRERQCIYLLADISDLYIHKIHNVINCIFYCRHCFCHKASHTCDIRFQPFPKCDLGGFYGPAHFFQGSGKIILHGFGHPVCRACGIINLSGKALPVLFACIYNGYTESWIIPNL